MPLPFSRLNARRYLWYGAVPFFWVSSTIIFVNDNILEVTNITGTSMSPTLSRDYDTTGRGDSILWYKWNPRKDLRRGDIVLFGTPGNPEATAVKRVIAMAGDTVLLDPRRRPCRKVDDADLPESRSWDMWPSRRAKVPEGHLWVEGDNWRKSNDSNWYGPISTNLIMGKAVAIARPLDRFGEKPWYGYKSRTRVVPAQMQKTTDTDEVALIEAAG